MRANAAVCGTASGYERHRRRGEQPCQPCTDAKRVQVLASRRRRKGGPSTREVRSHASTDGELEVECWCRDRIVFVKPELVQRGLTGSCGAPGCTPGVVHSSTHSPASGTPQTVRKTMTP